MQHKSFLASSKIDQNDIQEVQDDFCKFLMWEVIKEGAYSLIVSQSMPQIPSL
jgi:hypothetical protein